MANVYTRLHKRPRTTTLTDFSLEKTHPRLFPRLNSPTRRQNPHSVGLKYQSPYNKDNQTFGIWTPDFNLILSRFPNMLSHIKRTNWTCKVPDMELHNRCDAKPPEIIYTLNTTSRVSYGDPHTLFPFMKKYQHPTTRFGSSPHEGPVTGIVPNVLPPIRKEGAKEVITKKDTPNTNKKV